METNYLDILESNRLKLIDELISEYGLSKKSIAEKMQMNENTFRLKINKNFKQYKFSQKEIDSLCKVVAELGLRASLVSV